MIYLNICRKRTLEKSFPRGWVSVKYKNEKKIDCFIINSRSLLYWGILKNYFPLKSQLNRFPPFIFISSTLNKKVILKFYSSVWRLSSGNRISCNSQRSLTWNLSYNIKTLLPEKVTRENKFIIQMVLPLNKTKLSCLFNR